MLQTGSHFVLVARNKEKLQQNADDLKVRGAEKVDILQVDFSDVTQVNECIANVTQTYPKIDLAILAHSILPNNNQAILETMQTNTISTMLLLSALSAHMAQNSAGTIALISSVAGDRGRQSNYLYGSGKAALDAFASGLRQTYHKKNVHIVTIKPGFVATPMTQHMKQNFLFSTPEKIAPMITKAINKRKNVVYVPGIWRYVMLIIRMIPDPIFKRIAL